MVDAVIFDMDGLMIDTETVNYLAFSHFFNSIGVELKKDDYCICFTGRSVENALKASKELLHLNFEIEEAKKYLDSHMYLFKKKDIPLKTGLIELLDYLKSKDKKLAIATSSNIERVYELFESYKVLEYFDKIICGNDVTYGKPAPDIFLKACEKLGVEPFRALVLEDSEVGIEAAYCAHIPVICIPDMKAPDDKHIQMTTAILPTLKDVINFLE